MPRAARLRRTVDDRRPGVGPGITTTSWDSIESMRASATVMQPIRERAAEILGGTPEVAEWEIAVMHRDHRSQTGPRTRHLATG